MRVLTMETLMEDVALGLIEDEREPAAECVPVTLTVPVLLGADEPDKDTCDDGDCE